MNQNNRIGVCSLFSGIGGFETGIFQSYGQENVNVVFASEIDKYATQSYEILYEHQPFGDITKVSEKDIPDHDLLVAGFPCQSFSISGRRLGFSDTRGTLFFEIARIAKVKKPKILFLENVKGLVNHDKGRTLNAILEVLSDIGYRVDFRIMNSKFFFVPQSRERIYIVAVRNDLVKNENWTLSKKINLETKAKKKMMDNSSISTFNFDFPKEEKVIYKIEHILEENVDEKYYLSEEKTKRLIENLENRHKGITGKFLIDDQGRVNKKLKPLEISPTIRREMHGNEPRVVEPIVNSILQIEPSIQIEPSMQTEPSMQMVGLLDMKGNESIRRVYAIDGLAPTLTTMGGGHREPKIAVSDEKGGVIRYRIRKLTPLECFRLQHFPDSYYYKLRENGLSDTQLYKMAGNAVTTSVIASISNQFKSILTGRGDGV